MPIFSNITEYIELYPQHKQGLSQLRSILELTGLEETIKWKLPVYCLKGKNVVGLGAFKHHFSLWFFQGALLKDSAKVLENAQEGKTKAMRHWKFDGGEAMDIELITAYINEAIDNQQKGLVVTRTKSKVDTRELVLPEHLAKAIKDFSLEAKFYQLSPYKQKEYIEYIESAKREKTKISRLEKCIALIEQSKGLNDQYR